MRKFEVVKAYLDKGINLPKRATKHSAGYDIECAERVEIKPGEIVKIPTGLKVSMPHDEALFVYPRSSLGIKKGLVTSNAVGVVDSDYYNNQDNEGHLMIPLLNFSKDVVVIEKGERVAQGIFHKFYLTDDDLASDNQRTGGFGSSGK
ncbi:deoxyuridine 5'triphosphate nucleotidohydrolase dUTPase [Acholeplasma hippikon]|uniref:dUTP diphosphatase n=2 Tax=Acholeplasma hippikon TaxID=264636 RepID=A0A449BL62_9MOLU|nr:dUTP diphosphatase [Acholeplasma hippikon]VEU83211.1 deoxyuridine 5'triphosphate nucleotidohydrolase dUTPase [Acholeplasma hippikon]